MSEDHRVESVALPKMSQLAHRALAGIGISDLAGVTKHSEQEIANLHGMGPKSIRELKAALAEYGWDFLQQS